MTVSSEDRYLLLLKKNIFIPEGARFCPDHVTNRRFKSEAIDKIAPYSTQMKKVNAVDVQLLLSNCQMLYEDKKRFDFDNSQSMSDDEYRTLTSLSKSQFDDLIGRLSQSNILNSSNRPIRTAIAILLCKLRLGLSNQMLDHLIITFSCTRNHETMNFKEKHSTFTKKRSLLKPMMIVSTTQSWATQFKKCPTQLNSTQLNF
ncbi:unnamed protein product [Rotaria magnacalcarata]|uniref:Uncharacterized protein n=1 Tax=Rotaria magnacalcarata TaxID=392030 RepID=A0A816M5Y5_9BILA|nr:unnamed protein product [Rotaria magnacalcarata]